ncbi:unnamed protein product [Urochloa humidicola]
MDGRLPTNAAAGTEVSEGLGEQAGASPTPGRNFSSPSPPPEETELSAERLGAQAADSMFPTIGNSLTYFNAVNPANGVEYEVNQFSTAMEVELDGAIAGKTIQGTTAGVSAHNQGAHVHSFADLQVGRGGASPTPGRNFSSSSPPPPAEETEWRAERLSAKAAGAYRMFSSTEDRESVINNMKAAAAANRVEFDASPITTMIELEVGKELDKRTTAGGSLHDEGAHVRNFEFADPPVGRGGGATTTMDLARMKADETIAEATSAAMKVAKEAGDVVAGHKLF